MSRDYHQPEYLSQANMHVPTIQQQQQFQQEQPQQFQQEQPQQFLQEQPQQFQQEQPQSLIYISHYPMQHQSQTLVNTGASPAYKLTAAAASTSSPAAADVETSSLHPIDSRKRNTSHYGEYQMTNQQCSGSERSLGMAGSESNSNSAVSGCTRKRKSSFGTGSSFDEDCDASRNMCFSVAAPDDKKENHSKIEKRRRDKMNKYINELSSMIPMCGAMSRKLDKLSVLRLAVSYLRSVRGAIMAGGVLAQGPTPGLLPQHDQNGLLLEAMRAHGAFLFVVGCDGGRLLYVSHSVYSQLQYQQSELVGHSLFDILHPKDVAKVKEQLSSDYTPRERLIDAKTMLPVRSEVVSGTQRLSPGARRSFFCRIKCKQPPDQPVKIKPPSMPPPTPASNKEHGVKHRKNKEKKYCVVQCNGYLKSWTALELESAGCEDEEQQVSLPCLVAVCRALAEPSGPTAPPALPLQYVSRHALDGKFLFVDQRVKLALGFLPQELLGTSLYEYVTGTELGMLARAHKHALIRKQALHTAPYLFRRKDGSTATIQTHFKPFRNPWTKEIECLVAKNTVLPDKEKAPHPYEPFKQNEEWRDYLLGGGQSAGAGGEQVAAGHAAAGQAAPGQAAAEQAAAEQAAAEQAAAEQPAAKQAAVGQAVAGKVADGSAHSTNTESDSEVPRLIASQVEAHKIGACIAEEARRQPPTTQHAPHIHLINDPIFNTSLDNILGMDPFSMRNMTMSMSGSDSTHGSGVSLPFSDSPPLPLPLPVDGNSEATMAVIMSLLEADAGLGISINDSTLPWPLP